ncbi:DUF4974 domain-containing protein (plasmid) [Pedobacter sp. BS3]|uniref:FecR family protein n=1 Tax=Pedobacter sp. BS3 TaxID=2567937 RepID=UPI0011EC37DE|nr:FecR family protein [Pedobacter sp. BS3]TZF86301.1 DUF4974 domain-containing protein [Pedobacter sp. BS3]
MQSIDLENLLKKYKEGTCTQEELDLLENWYLQWKADDVTPGHEDIERVKAEVWASLPVHGAQTAAAPIHRRLYWKLGTAAAIAAIILSTGLYFYRHYPDNNIIKKDNSYTSDIQPGGNKAFLILANGKKISLTDAAKGKLAEQSGVKITKTADGQLVYTVSKTTSSLKARKGAVAFNTIETPRGGQYQVILPDGTKVWLNAASSLTYPTVFTGNERRVTLTGEGYFEVAKAPLNPPKGGKSGTTNSLSRQLTGQGEARLPFIVTAGNQEVEVLGTHFNINAYTDEEAIRTTLLEGSVKVSYLTSHISHLNNGVRLKPGQQARLSKASGIEVMNVNTEDAVAWKNGYFKFNRDNTPGVMRQISRWYDIDVVYEGNIPDYEFVGVIRRSVTISQVLKMLELSNVHFRIEGRKVIITQ